MNVLHLIQYFRIGGTEQVIKDLVVHANGSCRPMVCALRKTGYVADEVRKHGIKVHLIGAVPGKTPGWKIVRELRRVIRENHIDVLHCHDLGSWQYGMLAKWISGQKKIVSTRHGNMEPAFRKWMLLSRFLSFFTDDIAAVSPEVKQNMVLKDKIPEKRIKVVFNGIDLEKYRIPMDRKTALERIGLSVEHFVTGTVTRFYPVKNVEMQIEMVDRLKDRIPNLKHLIVAPIDANGERIRAKIQERKLENNIECLGFRTDVPELLKAMDVFLMTSLSEGTCLAIIEAMAANRALVVSRVGGNPFLIDHMRTGLLFDVTSVDDLCNQVMFMFENPSQKRVLEENVGEESRKFSVEEMVHNYQQIYVS